VPVEAEAVESSSEEASASSSEAASSAVDSSSATDSSEDSASDEEELSAVDELESSPQPANAVVAIARVATNANVLLSLFILEFPP
jgi:hypothetical protein